MEISIKFFSSSVWNLVKVLHLLLNYQHLYSKMISQLNNKEFSMDIAMMRQNDLVIIELGDGQVTGLLDHADIKFL